MLRVYLAAFLLFFVFSVCYPQQQGNFVKGAESGNPKVQGDSYIKDFGLIKAGEIVRHSFVIKNESKKVLNIKGASTSCGCIVSEVKNKMLKPGENTVVEVKFNSKGYSGLVQQFVYVNTDSLDNPIIRFIIKAYVVK